MSVTIMVSEQVAFTPELAVIDVIVLFPFATQGSLDCNLYI